MNRHLSGALDFSRWLAAIAVVICHAANIMVARVGDTPLAYRTIVFDIWLFFEGFGHPSVVIFFVLSGFLVGGGLTKQAREAGEIDWARYLVDRLSRVELVLVPALCFTFLLDKFTAHLSPELMSVGIGSGTRDWPTFFGNIACLQNFYVDRFGSDGPLGTLANEFWYYFTFPLLLSPILYRSSKMSRILQFICGLLLCILLGLRQPAHILGFIVWGIGIGASQVKVSSMKNSRAATAFLFAVLIGIRLIMRREMTENLWIGFAADLALSLAFGNLLLTLRFSPTRPERTFLLSHWHKFLASFTYSLYACHFPTLLLISSLLKHYTGFGAVDVVATPIQWIEVLGAISLTVIVAYLFSLVTERHTRRSRLALSKLLGVRVPLSSDSATVRRNPHIIAPGYIQSSTD